MKGFRGMSPHREQEEKKPRRQRQILGAKRLECKSWLDSEVFDLVATRKIKVKNWVTNHWVLTLKRDKDGNFLKTNARRVPRAFQDKQKDSSFKKWFSISNTSSCEHGLTWI